MDPLIFFAAACSLFITFSMAAPAPVIPSEVIALFNGKDLSGFDTWLVDFHRTDPDRVFSVVPQVDGAPAIRISGQHFGGIVTQQRYSNYRLVAEFRWGKATWAPRRSNARDSGILLHCQGELGSCRSDFNSPWMRSFEFQIIEGGTGDLLVLPGYDRTGGPVIRSEITATTNGENRVWRKGGVPVKVNGGRIDWSGRDPAWRDELGFRGRQDVEKPSGQWNRAEIVCAGNSLRYFLNGFLVNAATATSYREGRILFQSEGAEIFFRKIELRPLTAP
jgi:hypothetical protein